MHDDLAGHDGPSRGRAAFRVSRRPSAAPPAAGRSGWGGRARAVVASAVVAALLPGSVGACGVVRPEKGAPPAAPSQSLRVQVRATLPHDPRAFTQGLELRGGILYESTGLVGRSSLRAGPPGKPPTVYAELPAPLFGEGITLTGDTLWQLTWRNGIAIERDPTTLAERRRVSYRGEGWGLCHQQAAGRGRLVMSDGSDRLTFRDPDTFEVTGGIHVRHGGRPVPRLNELECVPGGSLYANVHGTDTIVRIDPRTGAVTAQIDAAGLLPASERRAGRQLNGIAAVPGTDTFLITGKLWPRMFEVTFVPR